MKKWYGLAVQYLGDIFGLVGLGAVTVISMACSTENILGGAPNPASIVPPEGPVLLAVNQRSGSATMVEVRTGRIVAHIPIGSGPHEIAASPDGRSAVATLPGDGDGKKLAVIDVATATLRRTIDLGEYAWPHGIAFLSDGRTVVVTSRPRQAAVFVDIEAGVVLGALSTGNAGPHLLALSGDQQRIYTTNLRSGGVSELDRAMRTPPRSISVPGVPEGIAVSPDGSMAWVQSHEADVLTLLDLKTGAAIATFGGFAIPYRVGISSDGSTVLATDLERHEVRIYDALGRRESGRVSTEQGTAPSGVCFAPDSKLAYVTLSAGNSIVELDTNSQTVVRRFKTQSNPDGVVYIPR